MNERPDNATAPVGPELIGQLIDQHAAALELYAGQWCDCPEDVVQDALIELARRREAPGRVLGWLYRAVRHRAMNAGRSTRRRGRREAEAVRQRDARFVPTRADAVDAETVKAALEQLPPEQREVVVAHVWGGLTFEEIGRVVGTSDSTAHRRYLIAMAPHLKRLVFLLSSSWQLAAGADKQGLSMPPTPRERTFSTCPKVS